MDVKEKMAASDSSKNTKMKIINIFLLGLCFFFVFTGFNTMSLSQNLIYSSADSTGEIPGFSVNGLITNGIVYGVFAFAAWFSPSIVVFLGPRISMMLAALTYLFNITQLLYLNEISVYPASVILGIGAPIIWTAQGTFLANNSDPKTITRNSGVFWAMNMSSALAGNLFAYFLFKDEEFIYKETRMTLGWVLTAASGVGILIMLLLRPTPWAEKEGEQDSMVTTLKKSFKLFTTNEMLLFSITMFFTGLNQTLWAGVYSTCIGFTGGFGVDRKALGNVSGIIVAAGEVLGGILFGFLGHLTVKRGRHPIIILGFVLSMVAYILMFINIPNEAPIDETTKVGFIEPSKGLALATSFILGFSDSCFMTQVTSMLGGIWSDQPACAFGLFKFVQSLGSAIYFFYSWKLGFYWQLLILAVFDIVGTIAGVKVEMDFIRKSRIDEQAEKE